MPPPSRPPPPPRDVFLAFQGGGAAGLAHLGALHAIEAADRLRPVAFAGTSAGAMVAALVAAGYRAEELFALGPDSGRTILDLLTDAHGRRRHADATALFGEAGWRRVARFRRLYADGEPLAGLLLYAAVAGLGGGIALGSLLPVLAGLAGANAGLLVGLRTLLAGGADLTPVRDVFAEALRRRLRGGGPGGTPTFADFEAAGRALKICATNITARRLELFCAETTPGLPVADAVAASICFPGAFRPWRIGQHLFLDGGLLSNLPAWPFDEERRINPDALTIAVSIEDATPRPPPSERGWLGAALRTVVLGGESLSTRGAGPIEILRIRSDVDVFDFDIAMPRARHAVLAARDQAAAALAEQVTAVPEDFRLRCADVARVAAALLAAVPSVFAGGVVEDGLRVALAVPEDHVRGGLVPSPRPGAPHPARALTYRFGHGFDGHADEALVVPLGYRGQPARSIAARAWTSGQSAFEALATPTDGFDAAYDRRRRAVVRRGLAWVFCIPLRLPAFARHPVTLAGSPAALAAHPGEASTVDALLVLDGVRPLSGDPAALSLLAGTLDLIEHEVVPIIRGEAGR